MGHGYLQHAATDLADPRVLAARFADGRGPGFFQFRPRAEPGQPARRTVRSGFPTAASGRAVSGSTCRRSQTLREATGALAPSTLTPKVDVFSS